MEAYLATSVYGDWQALYIGGRLAMQGHRLDIKEVLRAVGYKVTGLVMPEDWAKCPGSLSDWTETDKA